MFRDVCLDCHAEARRFISDHGQHAAQCAAVSHQRVNARAKARDGRHVQGSAENEIVGENDFVARCNSAEFKVQNSARVQGEIAAQRQRADVVAAGSERAARIDRHRAGDVANAAKRAAVGDDHDIAAAAAAGRVVDEQRAAIDRRAAVVCAGGGQRELCRCQF